MLRALRGNAHRVFSGLCLWQIPDGEPKVRVAVTHLFMDPLSDAAIEEYLASGDWEGKAGAFGYQDRLGWVRVTEGSESNVVGLPLELLAEMLGETAVG
jgi:septum formation protein